MDTIAFFNIPAYGHIRPTLPVVRALVKQGARVLYFIDEAYREVVASTGAEVRVIPSYSPLPAGKLPKSMVQFAAIMARQAYESLPALIEQVETEQIGLIVHDSLCPWGRFLAETTGRPSIRTVGVLMALDPAIAKMKLTPTIVMNQVRNLPDLIRFFRLSKKLRSKFGLNDVGLANILRNRADRSVIFTSREFLIQSELLDDSCHFVGSSFSEDGESDFSLPDPAGRPVIYISLGTTFTDAPTFYRNCKTAFASTDSLVIMSVGSKFDPRTLDPLPDNFVVASYVPQIDVLKQTSLFISHGGGCSVMESLWHGVPMLVSPLAPEHLFNARCVERQEAGVILQPADLTPDRLREIAFSMLGDARYREGAQRVGETFRTAGGPERAAELILEFQHDR